MNSPLRFTIVTACRNAAATYPNEFGVETIVLFPIKFQNELLGYMWATNFAPEKAAAISAFLPNDFSLKHKRRIVYQESPAFA